MIFCIIGKDGISFSYKYDMTLLSKKVKMTFSQKNSIKDEISSISEKHDIHPRKYGTSSNRKIKLYAWKYFTMKNI